MAKSNAKMTKQDALQLALTRIESQFGKGSIMRLGDDASRFDVPYIPTGILPLDIALGIGGIPRGRVIEVYGPEASGKTTITLLIIAEAQKLGGTAAFIDAEHALDPGYAQKLGVDIDNLYIAQPDTGEQALEIADTLMRSGALDIIVIDSVAALVPKAEIDGEMGDTHVGLQARLMSQALRKLTGAISKTNTSMIFINQIRSNIGGFGFGPKETTTGGRALKFYSSVRLDIRRTASITHNGEVIGNNVSVKVVKNKMAPPFKKSALELIYGEGISKTGYLLDMGVEKKIIKKSGSWFSWGDERLGQGREGVRSKMKENPALLEKLTKAIMDAYDFHPGASKVEDEVTVIPKTEPLVGVDVSDAEVNFESQILDGDELE